MKKIINHASFIEKLETLIYTYINFLKLLFIQNHL